MAGQQVSPTPTLPLTLTLTPTLTPTPTLTLTRYVPGRFSFNINERCTGSTCVRAHRHRLLRRAKKKRRAKLL